MKTPYLQKSIIEPAPKQPYASRALFRQVWPPLLLASLLRLLETKAKLGGGASAAAAAVTTTAMHWQALQLGGGLALSLTLKALCESQYFFHGQNVGTKVVGQPCARVA
jgi:hypothetical protein